MKEYSVNVSAYGTVSDGVTDNSVAFQKAIDYMANTYSGGHVLISPGNYCLHHGIVIKNSVQLVGSGIGCTLLHSKQHDINTVTFDGSCFQASLSNIFVCGYEGPNPQTNCITVARNVPVIIRDVYAWNGYNGIYTQGIDGLYDNIFAAGQICGIASNGANWYRRVKMDQLDAGKPSSWGFLHGSIFEGEIMENDFEQCDFSGPFSYSIFIDDSTVAPQAKMTFGAGCVFSQRIHVGKAQWTGWNNCEFSGAAFDNGSPATITGCKSFRPITVANAVKAANINIT